MIKSLGRRLTYLVVAKDYPGVLPKRLKVRPSHLENGKKAKADGFILLGSATLSDKNEMDGSMMVFDAKSKEEIVKHLESDPYFTAGVWQSYTIKPIKIAAVSPKLKEY